MYSAIRIKYVGVLFVIVSLCLCVIASFGRCQDDDRIIAVVNGEAITQRDADEYLGMVYLQMSTQMDTASVEERIKAMAPEVRDVLIENKLMVQEAKHRNLLADKSIINAELDSIRSRFKADKEFQQELASQGFSLGELKKKITDKILMHQIVEREVRSKVFVNPREVTDYYNAHLEEFRSEEEANLDSIFVPIKGSEDFAKQKAYDALAALKKGEDFVKVQERYSEVKSLGQVKISALKKELSDALVNLKEGEISVPVKISEGFFILRLNKRIPPGAQSISEVQDSIHSALFQRKFQERFSVWIDELKEKAFILLK